MKNTDEARGYEDGLNGQAFSVELKTWGMKTFTVTNFYDGAIHGIPMAVVDGHAYGPHEQLPVWPGYDPLAFLYEEAQMTVLSVIEEMEKEGTIDAASAEAARSFCPALRPDKPAEPEINARKSVDALAKGRFEKASKKSLKAYFQPPFARNHLADVDEERRAVLYTEIESKSWKAGKGDWRHKSVGTRRGYLCGIDEKGGVWGENVDLTDVLERDEHGDYLYNATVEEAMAVLSGNVPARRRSRSFGHGC